MPTSNNQIAQATEVVKSIPDFITAVADVIQTPSGLIVTAFVIVWFVINRDFTNISNLFKNKENKRLERLEAYVSAPEHADPKTLQIAKEQRDTYYFKVSTNGIYAELELREELIKLHESTTHHINWTIIRRAIPFLKLSDDGKLYVKDKTLADIISIYYNRFIAVMLVVATIGSLFLLIFTTEPTFVTTLKMGLLALFFGLGTLAVLSQNFPTSAADKIIKELEQSDVKKDNLPIS